MSIDRDLYEDDNIIIDWMYCSGKLRLWYRLKKHAGIEFPFYEDKNLMLTEPITKENIRELRDLLTCLDLDNENPE